MRAAALAFGSLAIGACAPHVSPQATKPAAAGVSIAMYESDGHGYSVVDDRRWLDISGSSTLLANIDPGASLASLVIEPNPDRGKALKIGPCVRDRLPDVEHADALEEFGKRQQELAQLRRAVPRRYQSYVPPDPEPPALPKGPRYAPVVRCDVAGKPGRYLVRIVYVSSTLRYRAQHAVSVVATAGDAPRRATVSSRFAIVTPPWRVQADVVLFDGAPGGDTPLREVARGPITLDGSTSVLANPEQTVAAEVRRVYDGAILASEDKQDVMWGHDSVQSVWVWLELAKLHLAPGPIDIHLDLPGEGVRDAVVAQTSRKQDDAPDAPLRLALWADESLRGSRQRIVDYNDGHALTERVILGVGNMGETSRDVFVEEHLRPANKRRVDRAWPKKPSAAGDVLRTKLAIKPGGIVRTGYTIFYEF